MRHLRQPCKTFANSYFKANVLLFRSIAYALLRNFEMSSERVKEKVVVAAMYRFTRLANYQAMKDPLLAHCLEQGIKGTILLAEEGLNATIAGSRYGIDSLLRYLRSDPRLAPLTCKESLADQAPFHRIKIKLKKEIVTMGIPDTDPNELHGTRVDAKQWNDLITDPSVLVIDTRNEYEHGIGTFTNAISPRTETFREFPAYVNEQLDAEKHRKIAMFCTGGIRCEKATNYLMKQGFAHVYHLDGGILKYLETVNPDESLWRGECFVFDERVAVDENLEQGNYTQCFACRRPLSESDRKSADYQAGISCPHCIGKVSDDKKNRLAERQRQIHLARTRNEQHRGTSLRK
ncbi:MAG: UPF0176 protein [Gammaproteobacteria bacterium]